MFGLFVVNEGRSSLVVMMIAIGLNGGSGGEGSGGGGGSGGCGGGIDFEKVTEKGFHGRVCVWDMVDDDDKGGGELISQIQ